MPLQFQASCDFYASEPGRALRVLTQPSRQHQRLGNRTTDFSTVQLVLGRSYSLLFNQQFQSFKLLLGHALQSHRCGQIQSGNVFHFVAPCYLATEFLYFWVSAHSQKHFIRIGDGQSLFNQAMLNQNAMIRRYCQRRWMGLRSALVLSWVFHCTMLTRFLNPVISWCSYGPKLCTVDSMLCVFVPHCGYEPIVTSEGTFRFRGLQFCRPPSALEMNGMRSRL